MEYKEAREYCTALLVCRKAIDKAIAKYRGQQDKQQIKMLKSLYADFDPEGDSIFKGSRMEVPFVKVQWGKRKDSFNLERPEAWLKSFREALAIYKSIAGKVKYNWIVAHFTKEQNITGIAARHLVTRSTVYNELDIFKSILLIVCVQNGLVHIEQNKKAEDE